MTNRPTLVRGLNRWHLTGLAVNNIIGAGIFGLPTTAAKLLGVASPLGFVLSAAIVYLVVLCFAEAAGYFRETGGPYLYSRAVFGKFVGFEVGWAAWLARVSSFAANTNLLLTYLGFFIPGVISGLQRGAVLIAVPAVLGILNIIGVKSSARVGGVFALTKVGTLALFGIIGLAFVKWNTFSGISVPENAHWGEAVLLLIYAYMGFEGSVMPAGESENPVRDNAWSLIVALAVCASIYVVIQTVAVGTVPDLATADRPLIASGVMILGPIAGALISILVCISVIGNLSANALITPRLTYAFAERGDFPALFAKLHPIYRTPVASIVLFTVVSMILAISGTFVWLVALSVVARLATYILTCLAVPALRKHSPGQPGFRLPMGPLIPLAGVLACLWLLSHASSTDLRVFVVAAMVGAGLYLLRTRRRTHGQL
jgi:amino acid transporter